MNDTAGVSLDASARVSRVIDWCGILLLPYCSCVAPISTRGVSGWDTRRTWSVGFGRCDREIGFGKSDIESLGRPVLESVGA